ncbi:hypothetical protein D3C86_2129630 [compost metagenome]
MLAHDIRLANTASPAATGMAHRRRRLEIILLLPLFDEKRRLIRKKDRSAKSVGLTLRRRGERKGVEKGLLVQQF